MRVGRRPDNVAVRAELAVINALRPLARSSAPYELLREAAIQGGITRDRERQLRRVHHNAGRNFELLTSEKLVRRATGERIVATRKGADLVEAVQRAAETPGSSVLEGRRVLAVAGDTAGDLQEAAAALAGVGADVLYSEGAYDLIAVLPDDFDLVANLTRRLRELGNRTAATRVMGRA